MSSTSSTSSPDTMETPCLVVDLDRLKANIAAIRQKCQQLGVSLRPNMAEHRCREIGELVTDGTKKCIAVSSLAQAEFFADGGFEDILYVNLFTADKICRLKKLSEKLQQFHLMVDSGSAIDLLESNPLVAGKQWSVFLLVDCGHGQGGAQCDSPSLVELAKKVAASPHLTLQGLYTRDANIEEIKKREMAVEEMMPASKGQEIMREAAAKTMEKLLEVTSKLQEAGVKYKTLSGGSIQTVFNPSEKTNQLTEVHVENYAFKDLRNANIGVCGVKDIAMRVATRVVGHYPHKNQLLVDAGSAALGLDAKDALPNQHLIYVYDNPALVLRTMVEEVSVIEPKKRSLDYSKYPVGSLLYLVPYNARSTASLHQEYLIKQDQKIIAQWKACSAGH